jgi:hypothetical protein
VAPGIQCTPQIQRFQQLKVIGSWPPPYKSGLSEVSLARSCPASPEEPVKHRQARGSQVSAGVSRRAGASCRLAAPQKVLSSPPPQMSALLFLLPSRVTPVPPAPALPLVRARTERVAALTWSASHGARHRGGSHLARSPTAAARAQRKPRTWGGGKERRGQLHGPRARRACSALRSAACAAALGRCWTHGRLGAEGSRRGPGVRAPASGGPEFKPQYHPTKAHAHYRDPGPKGDASLFRDEGSSAAQTVPKLLAPAILLSQPGRQLGPQTPVAVPRLLKNFWACDWKIYSRTQGSWNNFLLFLSFILENYASYPSQKNLENIWLNKWKK